MGDLLAVGTVDGRVEPAALYAPVVCAPRCGVPSDGLWLTGRVGALQVDGELVEVDHPHSNPLPQGDGEGERRGRWLVVGWAALVGLWLLALGVTVLAVLR